ncbi:hypothetical protein QAD02_023045 [Eretmocerus hayati]|uniref:Uncharacterized protein n=1 Tax=Eretmocerus hayati TaxID=131215 RepID=A0ACC2PWU6_9HYME|nr:hypothetical protein QAD02_023045 [Eretmocerus hayati]
MRLSSRLTNLKSQVPIEFQRTTSDSNEFHNWKATDYRFFLLYVCMLVLKDVLGETAYKYSLLLSSRCHILCNQDYFKENYEVAKECLNKFVVSAQHPDLYGLKILIINSHNLLHSAEQVKYMGAPLMDISAFDFESILGKLKDLIESGNKPLSQLCSKIDNYLKCEKPILQPDFQIFPENKEDEFGKVVLRRVKHHSSELNMNDANSAVMLNNGKIVWIKSTFTYNSKTSNMEDICITAKGIDIIGPAVDYPINSSLLNMYKVNERDSCPIMDVTLKDVRFKVALFNVFELQWGRHQQSPGIPKGFVALTVSQQRGLLAPLSMTVLKSWTKEVGDDVNLVRFMVGQPGPHDYTMISQLAQLEAKKAPDF